MPSVGSSYLKDLTIDKVYLTVASPWGGTSPQRIISIIKSHNRVLVELVQDSLITYLDGYALDGNNAS
ncbi:hypothetical protein BCON_0225g00100 [Botryotinia convoluta]|uniref:Uncharacterized protein n=1 Tax=Botryotinia convoluta TaxID=54673 RepID=A0A4Z1HJ33_9HELO|nr:hypothetical protein BCON_0225g00100 [Botryotinia convoluta]